MGNARPANMPNHHNARSKQTPFDRQNGTRRRLAEKTIYACWRENNQHKMEWMSYPQKDSDDINANLSTGPVELVFGQNKFKVGLVQRSPRNGCTRPVRMMKDGTFEVDLANRCVYPIADYRVPIWTPYSENSNRAIHFRLAKANTRTSPRTPRTSPRMGFHSP